MTLEKYTYTMRTYDRAIAKANSAARHAMWNANATMQQQVRYGKQFPWMFELQAEYYGDYLAYRALASDVIATM